MATRVITRMYDVFADAEHVVNRLEAAGVPHSSIGLIASRGDDAAAEGGDGRDERTGDPGTKAAAGAGIGGAVGAGAGLLAGLGLLAIPGLGPVVAAGWVAATLTGAATGATLGAGTGGVIGALTSEGVSDRDADVYAEGVRRGGALVSVRADDAEVPRIEQILNERATVDPGARRAEYEGAGWTGFRDVPGGGNTAAAGGNIGRAGTAAEPGIADVATGGVGTTGTGVAGVDPAGGLGRGERAAGSSPDLAHAARGESDRPDVIRPKPASETAVDRDPGRTTADPDLDPPPRG